MFLTEPDITAGFGLRIGKVSPGRLIATWTASNSQTNFNSTAMPASSPSMWRGMLLVAVCVIPPFGSKMWKD